MCEVFDLCNFFKMFLGSPRAWSNFERFTAGRRCVCMCMCVCGIK